MDGEEPVPQESVSNLKQFLKTHVPSSELPKLEEDLKRTISLSKRKTKKETKRKRNKKSKYITRNEKKALGLFHLPNKGMKYSDVLPMNQMWNDYMRHQLDLDEQRVPQIEEKSWENFSLCIFKSDFHGALISVTRSKCPSLVGLSGICVIDTKNTFKLLCKDNIIRTIPKQESVFVLHMKDMELTIFGKHINRRPAERSVKISKLFTISDL